MIDVNILLHSLESSLSTRFHTKFNVLFAGSAFHVPIRSCAHSKLTGRIHNNRKDENGDALRFYRNQPLHRVEEKADGDGEG